MSQTRSGYVIEIPLGLGTTIEIDFEIDEETDGVGEVTSHMTDESGVYPVPQALEPLVEQYLKTWLMEPSDRYPDTWSPQPWISGRQWHEQTRFRLGELFLDKKATWKDDLDD